MSVVRYVALSLHNFVEFVREGVLALIVLLIRLYQLFISPALPASCIHQPTCSSYAILAFRKYGLFRGFRMTLLRLLSCQARSKPRLKDYP